MKKTILLYLAIFIATANGQIISQNSLNMQPRFGFSSASEINIGDFGFTVPVYDVSADSLFNLMTVQPNARRKQLISDVYTLLKDSLNITSLNQAFDGFWMLQTTDSNDSKLDWSFNSNLTTVNKLNFRIDTGWIRNAAGSYINTGINISTAANFTQNSGSLMFWSKTDVNETSVDIGVFRNAPRFDSRISARLSGVMYGHLNIGTATNTIAVANSTGYYATSRTASNLTGYYKDADSLISFATASIALISANAFLTASNDGAGAAAFGTTRVYSFAAIGKGFTKTQIRAIYWIVKYYIDNW